MDVCVSGTDCVLYESLSPPTYQSLNLCLLALTNDLGVCEHASNVHHYTLRPLRVPDHLSSYGLICSGDFNLIVDQLVFKKLTLL